VFHQSFCALSDIALLTSVWSPKFQVIVHQAVSADIVSVLAQSSCVALVCASFILLVERKLSAPPAICIQCLGLLVPLHNVILSAK
jgi:hypothetical protein